MITVALFWTASNQKESKSLLPKGWINDLYTHAIEWYAVVRLNKPQVQTTVDETHKHDIDWEKLDRNEHTEAQASERSRTNPGQWLVWETGYSSVLGAGGKWCKGAWGVFGWGLVSISGSECQLHGCSWTFMELYIVDRCTILCVSYLNEKLIPII